MIIPDSVTYLGSHAFYKCNKLKNVTLGNGITEIEQYTFYKCPSLEYVTLSNNVTAIGNCAFAECERLKSLNLKGVESIGSYAFYSCHSLSSIDLSESIKSIGAFAFRGCTSLKSIVLSDTLTEIGQHAFYGLSDVTLYCETTKAPDGWDKKSNSSHRPVIYGCGLLEDGSVAYITISDDNIENKNALNGISNPERTGYTFEGWTTEEGGTTIEYTTDNLLDAPNGSTLYAIWLPQ